MLCVMVVIMLVAAEAAYGLGGGGSHGDGRTYFSPQTVRSDGSCSNDNNGIGQPGGNGYTVPEPVGLLFLGTGIMGLAGLRRKFRKS
jgi:hypothetical protein